MNEVDQVINGLNYLMGVIEATFKGSDVEDQIRQGCTVKISNAGNLINKLIQEGSVWSNKIQELTSENQKLQERCHQIGQERDQLQHDLDQIR